MAENPALKDPYLDAADAIGGVRLGLCIVDVASQRVQRNPALAIPFGTRDLGASEATRIPSAPRRRADCTARFMARRKAIRRSSWSATPCATRRASTSGLRISTMLRLTS